MAQRQIGSVVGHLLLKTGESTLDLAATLGVSEKTVKRRLAGSQDWTADEIVVLAQHFRVPVAVLFAGPDALFAGLLTEGGGQDQLHLKDSWKSRRSSAFGADRRATARDVPDRRVNAPGTRDGGFRFRRQTPVAV